MSNFEDLVKKAFGKMKLFREDVEQKLETLFSKNEEVEAKVIEMARLLEAEKLVNASLQEQIKFLVKKTEEFTVAIAFLKEAQIKPQEPPTEEVTVKVTPSMKKKVATPTAEDANVRNTPPAGKNKIQFGLINSSVKDLDIVADDEEGIVEEFVEATGAKVAQVTPEEDLLNVWS